MKIKNILGIIVLLTFFSQTELFSQVKYSGGDADGYAISFSPGITTGAIASGPFYVSSSYSASVNVPYTIIGIFNGSNVFTAYLSDASGSFDNENAIGTRTATNSGTISATIPTNTAAGSGYRIRVKSSDPAITGSNNGTDITITLISNSIAPTGAQTINENQSGTTLTVSETPDADSRQWKYGTSSGGPYDNNIVGKTAVTYTPLTYDLAAPCIYYLVCESTKEGVAATSNEVQINSESLLVHTEKYYGGNADGFSSSKTASDVSLPIVLSSFTAQFLNNVPTLYWTTQSETDNLGWYVYRSETDIFEEASQINIELIPGADTTSEPTDYIYEDESELMENTEYWYWLESIDYSGLTESYGSISLIIPEQGEEPGSPEIPGVYGLHQNYPNPFNPNTEISFMLKESCIGELSIYNVKGQKIKTIFTNLSIPRDELIISIWNGKDDNYQPVGSGFFFYKLKTANFEKTRKMILLK